MLSKVILRQSLLKSLNNKQKFTALYIFFKMVNFLVKMAEFGKILIVFLKKIKLMIKLHTSDNVLWVIRCCLGEFALL